ncbi:hypothetical protein J2S58_002850 [Nakamurella flavida]|nr:hypothetical protein [Nakamurella flavida]
MRCQHLRDFSTPAVSQASWSGSGRCRFGSASAGLTSPFAVVGTCWLRFCRVSMTDRSARSPKLKRRKNCRPRCGWGWYCSGSPDRHPLDVGLEGPGPAGQEIALGPHPGRLPGAGVRRVRVVLGFVVLRAGRVGVVGDLVVVEDDDPGVPTVRGLGVGIGLVERVAHAVVGQRDHLGLGLVVADADEAGRAVPVAGAGDPGLARVVAVLVHVVAEVQDRIEVVPGGQAPVGGEEAAGVVAAGHEGQPECVGHPRLVRRGLRPSHRRGGPATGEPEEVPGVGGEPVDHDLDGVVPGGAGGCRAPPQHGGVIAAREKAAAVAAPPLSRVRRGMPAWGFIGQACPAHTSG